MSLMLVLLRDKILKEYLPVHVLVNHYSVDETRGNEDNGYQRPHQNKRSLVLAESLDCFLSFTLK